jgi:hypothetical protein
LVPAADLQGPLMRIIRICIDSLSSLGV